MVSIFQAALRTQSSLLIISFINAMFHTCMLATHMVDHLPRSLLYDTPYKLLAILEYVSKRCEVKRETGLRAFHHR